MQEGTTTHRKVPPTLRTAGLASVHGTCRTGGLQLSWGHPKIRGVACEIYGYQSMTRWWFGTCFFPHIGFLIIPTDSFVLKVETANEVNIGHFSDMTINGF